MKNGIVIGTIACVVAIILIGSALAPIINMTTTTTTTVDNDGAVGLRMDKVSSGDFTINYGLVGDDFTATNGTDTQVIDDLCIIYADNNVAVWMDDSSIIMLGKDADNKTIDEKLSDESTITITKGSAALEITDGTITQTFPVPTWAYIPKSTGSYGFFLNETEINTGGLPVQYVGSFAGVNCYNSINSFDLPITLDAALTDSELSGARWIKQATETTPEELNPDDLHIIPLDPSVINPDPEPDASIMTVPTPTYTDGDWGYDLITSGDNAGKAVIVSYSGSGGNLTIPDSVGGYAVAEIGKGTNRSTVFDNNSISDTTITIPTTVKKINQYAFYNVSKLKGDLVIPSNVEQIGFSAFAQTGITSLSLTDGLKRIDTNAFYGCSNLITDLTIPNTVTALYDGAFSQCGGVNNIILPTGIDTISKLFQLTPITGDIIIPSNVNRIANMAFQKCGNNVGVIIIPDSVNRIDQEAFAITQYEGIVTMVNSGANIDAYAFFSGGATFGEVLNLGSLELTTTSYGLKSNEVRSDIPALGYLAPTQYKETVENDGPASVLLNVIPLITIVGVLLFAVGFTIYRRNY